MFTVTRSQCEITERFDAAIDGMFGWAREVLIDYLDFAHARQYLKGGVTESEWDEARSSDIDSEIRRYLDFAIGKIRDERGISAERSTVKLSELAWLAGRDDVVRAMDEADYGWYGSPKVQAFAIGMGLDWPADI